MLMLVLEILFMNLLIDLLFGFYLYYYMYELSYIMNFINLYTKKDCNQMPLICFDIVEVHLLERVLCQYGLVQGIPPPCDTEPELHIISPKNQCTMNWMEINWRHIALWDRRLELLAHMFMAHLLHHVASVTPSE